MLACPNCHFSLHARCVSVTAIMCPFCQELGNGGSVVPEEVVVDVSVHDSSDSSQADLHRQHQKPNPLDSPSKQRRFNMINDYIHGSDCNDLVKKYINTARIDRRQPMDPTASTNFEFFPVVHVKSRSILTSLRRQYEVKEVKQRASGSQHRKITKFGIYMTESVDPGVFIDLHLGHTHLWSTIVEKAGGRVLQPVPQTFVLCVDEPPGMAIDARRSGNEMRFIRRSCRPNVTIKPIITMDDQQLLFGVFAMNGLRASEELLAPIDGLPLFKYECACQSADLCLAPADLVPEQHLKTNRADDDYQYPYERNQTTTAAPSASAIDTRKMSREERKLQRYIEFFEKMDAIDAKGRKRSQSTTTSNISVKKPSPIKPSTSHSNSTPSSPSKSPKHLLKKQWLAHKIAVPTPILSTSSSTTSTHHEHIIDVVSLPTPPPPPPLATDDSRVTPLSQIISQEGTNVLGDGETPTRKRLSLNDYLEKRRKAASPVIPEPVVSVEEKAMVGNSNSCTSTSKELDKEEEEEEGQIVE